MPDFLDNSSGKFFEYQDGIDYNDIQAKETASAEEKISFENILNRYELPPELRGELIEDVMGYIDIESRASVCEFIHRLCYRLQNEKVGWALLKALGWNGAGLSLKKQANLMGTSPQYLSKIVLNLESQLSNDFPTIKTLGDRKCESSSKKVQTPSDEYYTISESTKYLKCSGKKLKKLIEDNDIRTTPYKKGSKLIHINDLTIIEGILEREKEWILN